MNTQNFGPRILAAGAAVQLVTGIPAAWGIFQEPVAQEYQFSHTQVSLVFALLVAAYGVGCTVGGYLQDARGPRFAGLLGTVLLGGGFLAAAFLPAGNALLFYLCFSLTAGAGSAFLCPAVLACAQKWYADRRGFATGITGIAAGLSGSFFTLFVRGIGKRFGMRLCFGLLGGLMLAVCGTGAMILKNPPAKRSKVQAGAQNGKNGKQGSSGSELAPAQMLRTPQYWVSAAAILLSAPAVLLFSPGILRFAQERGLAEQFTPWCVVLGSAASAAGRIACPAGSDAFGRRRVLCFVCAGLALGSLGFAFAAGWWVAVGYAALTFCYSGAAAVQPALASDLFGLKHAGVNYGFLALGMSAGSLLSYAGSQFLVPAARHWAAGACALAALGCYLLLGKLSGKRNRKTA
jgi:OFA family oxalate/formate antiporter-like MFS transporter